LAIKVQLVTADIRDSQRMQDLVQHADIVFHLHVWACGIPSILLRRIMR